MIDRIIESMVCARRSCRREWTQSGTMVILRGTKFKNHLCVIFGCLISVLSPTTSRGVYNYHSSSPRHYEAYFNDYYNANTRLTYQQRSEYQEYWKSMLSGRTDYILQSLRWMAENGHFDNYFMALNYLVFIHDNIHSSPHLLQLIENLIEESVQGNIMHSPVLTTNSVTYNIVKYLLTRFRPNISATTDVPYYIVNYGAAGPNYSEKLIRALGPRRGPQYYLLAKYLQSLPNHVYQQLDLRQSPQNYLQQLLSILCQRGNVSPQLYEAAEYYLGYLRNQNLIYRTKQNQARAIYSLAHYVPNIKSPHRDTLLRFLNSGAALQYASRSVPSEAYLNNVLVKALANPQFSGPLREALQYYVQYFQRALDFGHLSHELHQFKHGPGREHYNVLFDYLHSPQLQTILGPTGYGPLNRTSAHFLQETLHLLKSNDQVSNPVHKAADYFLKYYEMDAVRNKYSLNQLFNIIPKSSIPREKMHFENMYDMFDSSTFMQILQDSNLGTSSDKKAMLHDIFMLALKSPQIGREYKQTILHYLRLIYNEGLTWQQQEQIEFILAELQTIVTNNMMYAQISDFLRSDLSFLILSQNHVNFNQDSFIILEIILEDISQTSNLSNYTIEAANHYRRQVHAQYLQETEMMTKMHDAYSSLQGISGSKAEQYQTVLGKFLDSTEMHTILRNSHMNYNRSSNEMLYYIFLIIEEDANIPMDVREGAYYYGKYIMEPILGTVQYNSGELVSLFPKPSSDLSQKYFDTLTNYLKLGIPRFLESQIDFGKTSSNLLMNILQALLQSDGIPGDVRGAAKYYWDIFRRTNVPPDTSFLRNKLHRLTLMLPRPRNTREAHNYNLIVRFMKSGQLLQLLCQVNINIYQPDDKFLRDILLLILRNYNISIDVKTVARYYLKMMDNNIIGNVAYMLERRSLVQAMKTQSPLAHQTGTSTMLPVTVETAPTMYQTVPTTMPTLTAQQITFLGKLEQELDQFDISDKYIPDRQVLHKYLKTDLAYNLLASSGVDMDSPGHVLLIFLFQIAAHTNDIPVDLRLAAEHYEQFLPELKESYALNPGMHLVPLDTIFHRIDKSCLIGAPPVVALSYNAIDRFLHNDVPSTIMGNSRIDLTIAPNEVLQDFLTIAGSCAVMPEDRNYIQGLLARNNEQTYTIDYSLLEHLYRLHKVSQLFAMPDDPNFMEYYYSMDNFLNSNEIYQHLKLLEFNANLPDLQRSILLMIINAPPETIPYDVIQSALYYYNLLFAPTIEAEVENVLHLLPNSAENQAVEANNIIHQFIHSPAAMDLFQNINYNVHRRPRAILVNVLELVIYNGNVNPNVRNAARYLQKAYPGTAQTPQNAMKPRYSQRSVHAMKMLPPSMQGQSPQQNYGRLLNVLPNNFRSSNDYSVVQQYFTQLTPTVLEVSIPHEVLASFGNNEEGLFRMILLLLIQDPNLPEDLRLAFAHIIRQRYFDFGIFKKFIPNVANDENRHKQMLEFLDSDQIYRYIDLSNMDYDGSMQSYQQVMGRLLASQQLPEQNREIISYYADHYPFFETEDLIAQLPQPTANSVKRLYQTIVEYLRNKGLVYKCARNVDLAPLIGHPDLLLHHVLSQTEKCPAVDQSIQVATKYYLTMIKSAAVSVQKVLTKTLDLDDIFSDAFDLSILSPSQFDAYHAFWSYVSGRTPELLGMPAFDFWMGNNRRGEFTIKFLNALSTVQLPDEIINAIHILLPLVQTENAGALYV